MLNGVHIADYGQGADVPESKLRHLAIKPQRTDAIDAVELVKGPDATAPLVMAVTIESV